MRNLLVTLAFAGMVLGSAQAVVTHSTSHSTDSFGFESSLSSTDLIAGQIGVEGADNGWHGATPAEPARLVQLTDGATGGGLNGLLNDFPAAGAPTKIVSYSVGSDITGINILSGNDGADGRIFMTVAIYADNALLAYVESDPLGSLNNAQGDPNSYTSYRSTFVEIYDDASSVLAAGVSDLRFEFYAVDNTGGQYRDPFDGVNPFTGLDDGLSAAFVSPLIWEIDVLPEPASVILLSAALLLIRRR